MHAMFDSISGFSHSYIGIGLSGLLIGIIITALLLLVKKYVMVGKASTRFVGWLMVLFLVLSLPVIISVDLFEKNNTVTRIETTKADQPLAEADKVDSKSGKIYIEGLVDTSHLPAKDREIKKSEKALPAASLKNINPLSTFSISDMLWKLLPVVLICLWAVIASAYLVRLFISYLKIRKLKKESVEIDSEAFPKIKSMLEQGSYLRNIRICYSKKINIPMAAGLGNPMVLIPERLLKKLSAKELETIIIHEIAHLRRRDDWSNLLQQIIKALNFYHPAVYWINRQLDLEREIACDNYVIEQIGDPKFYAGCLTRLMQITSGTGTVLMPGALTGRKQIFKRFEELIMNDKKRKNCCSRVRFTGLMLLIAVFIVTVAQVTPVIAIPGKNISFSQLSQVYHDFRERNSSPETFKPDNDFVENNTEELTDWYRSKSTSTSNMYLAAGSTSDNFNWNFDQIEYSNSSKRSGRRGFLSDIFDWTDFWGNFEGTAISREDDDYYKIAWSDGKSRIGVILDGTVAFSDDDRGIKYLSNEGYMAISVKKRRDKKEIEIEADKDGNISYTYYENGSEKEMDDDIREWYGDIITDVIYKTGIGAEERVNRIIEKDGVQGVLKDIDRIESDYVAKKYYIELLNYEDLTEKEYADILRTIPYHFESDHEKAEILINISETIHENNNLIGDYIDVVKSIDSDYETRRVLSELSFSKKTDKKIIETVLEIAEDLGSDYEKAELLIEMSELCRDDSALSEIYINSINGIDSDYETRRVIDALGREKLSRQSLLEILELSSTINSDYEKAELLVDLSQDCRDDPELLSILIHEVADLDSDYETKRVLKEINLDCDRDTKLILEEFVILNSVSSDYETAEIMSHLADCASENAEIRAAYLKALRNISSDYEKSRTLERLINKSNLTRENILEIISYTSDISSDYEKSEILESLIKYCRGDEELEEAMFDAIDEISSDYEAKDLYYKMKKKSRRRSTDDGL